MIKVLLSGLGYKDAWQPEFLRTMYAALEGEEA